MKRALPVVLALAMLAAALTGCKKEEEHPLGIGTPGGPAPGGSAPGTSEARMNAPGAPGSGMPQTSEERRAMAEKMGIKIPPTRK